MPTPDSAQSQLPKLPASLFTTYDTDGTSYHCVYLELLSGIQTEENELA